ncbi:hypothetical protein HMPREF0063_10084 [Aeromicrobium marinum DSM 15272]|uniref:Uncharacterized protein n=1 Tax=Aeromicrobium marinum DSM 15272 TaxID=585531 RepID=E2S7S7_9ACTN|nr:hypothetical protein [Aeromicrobium marinum]EFQ84743.1 hypothetical protein HMPREF0063_10084 [Aeromicrobium marinum DSM 15272]
MPQDYAYHKLWRHERAQGRLRTVETTRARLHIASCLGAGMSIRAISAAAGVAPTAVHNIHRGQERARTVTVAKILQVVPGVTTAACKDTTESFVPKVGAVRRIQALLALGWSHAEQSKRAGVVTATAMHQQGRWITATTHQRIDDMYRDLCMTPGPSEVTRRRAAARGYVPPLAWDDIDTDPTPAAADATAGQVDEVAIARVLAGERLTLTSPERAEVFDRLMAEGRGWNEIERLTGMNVARQLRRSA